MSAFISKIWEHICDTVCPLKTELPQSSSRWALRRRSRQLSIARETYQFNYTHISSLAILDSVPIHDEFSFHWLEKISQFVLTALLNRAQLEEGEEAALLHKEKHFKLRSLIDRGLEAVQEIRKLIHEALRFEVRIGASAVSATALEDYAQLFRSIGLPPVNKHYQDDAAFGRMRVAGPNPVILRRMTAMDERIPIADKMFEIAAPDDSLDASMSEARLYMADYALLDGAPAGNFPNGQKYIAAPIAIFVVDKTTRFLKPIAIQCQQKPGSENPIFTPNDGWNWQIAKTFVEIADGNIHEAMIHLGRTHLVMEAFVVTTLRQMAANHPLSHLLRPHFEGTLAINKASWTHLIADKGGVEKLFSASITAARGLAVQSVQTLDVMNSLLPKTFAERGVDDASALPNYPYRDDSMIYWRAINKWVTAYARIYYPNDPEVQNDMELQSWGRELASVDGGRLRGIPNGGSLQSANQLIDVLTFVIYTCSVQHAAVNFPQYDLMSFTPNMPLSAYRPIPTAKTGATEADYLAMLPTLDMAELQMELGYLLGEMRYTELGQYSQSQFGHDKRIETPLKEFQQTVAAAGETIAKRNEMRLYPYSTLLPKGIPQSINI
ncbi:MAG TPA: lipoxygenase family protein [Gemmata sp.]|jgi:arachidonate 15-lipoxygenase|nr:lipoxygenase family protein [Gemmata sp.]